MEFGRVEGPALDKIDFSLKPEPLFNKNILSGNAASDARVYVGCAMWGVPGWIGKIYPPGTKDKDYLKYYTRHFNCIELNATHYKIYDGATIQQWLEKTAQSDFKYCPKMAQTITHKGSLLDKRVELKEFFTSVDHFGDKLGPIFIQLSDYFAPARKNELLQFLASLPKQYQFFLELRHEDWFKNNSLFEDFCAAVSKIGIGMVITDVAGRRDCSHMVLTCSSVFVRYVGNGMHHTDYTRIGDWVERTTFWLNNGLKEFYFLVHTHDEITAPEMSIDFIDRLNSSAGLSLKKPRFLEGFGKQQDLFG